jgi:hypothetical protein
LKRDALAGTRLTHDAQCFTLVDMERQPAHGIQSAVRGSERHAKLLDLKEPHFGQFSPMASGR